MRVQVPPSAPSAPETPSENLATSGSSPNEFRKTWNHDLSGHDCSHTGLLLYHRGRIAAERQERRHLRRIWWARQPDRFRSSWRRQCAFQSDDLVSSCVHDHVHHFVGVRFEAYRRSGIGAARDQVAACEDPTGNTSAATHSPAIQIVGLSQTNGSPSDSRKGLLVWEISYESGRGLAN